MKILVVQETDWLLRGPHQQHHLMERMIQRGHEVQVVDYNLLWKDEKSKGRLVSKGFVIETPGKVIEKSKIKLIRPKIIKLPIWDKLSIPLIYPKEIQKNINLFNPDVIIGLGLLNVHIARLKAKKNRIPFVFYSIDKNYSLVPSSLYKPFAKFLEKLNVLNADLVLTINKGLRNFALDLGCKQKNVKIITGGVDIESYCYKGNRKTIRKKYGYTEKDTVLFFMGWIYEFSGMKEVVLELAKYKDRNPNIKLLLVGEGDLFNELQLIRERYNLHDSVNLTGKQPFEKIPEFLAMSDICLLPAYYNDIMRDIVPIKVYEYMAASKPVIATRLPGIMEEFGKNHGIVYINKSEETLQKSLEMINRGIVKDEGIKARKFVEEYDWTKITNDFEKVLEELG